MFGIAKAAAQASWGITKGVGALATSGTGGRALLGGATGGIIGATRGYESSNLRDESIAKGALAGAAIGAFGFRTGKLGLPTPALGRVGTLLGGRYSAGVLASIADAGYGAAKHLGRFAANYPKTSLGLGVAATVGITGGLMKSNKYSPTLNPILGNKTLRPAFGMEMNGYVDPGYTPEAAMLAQQDITGGTGMIGTGTAMPAKALGSNSRAFMDSTAGLTQGLHKGRHG